MSINLVKHRDSLINAWKDVLDDKTATDWALFGYDGMSNDLKLVSKGDGGIEELTDDLNSGKIMYAFLRIEDTKTSLYKYVLVNWQGEGAPTVRKGTCANHIRDVGSFFSGAHLTLHARTEEDMDPQTVIDKVSNAGSAYSFKAPRSEMSGPTGPVGTTYVKVNPCKEINSKERDQFWLKEEQEEKNRIAAEKKRLDQERRKAEEEQRVRAEAEAVRLAKEDNTKEQRLFSPTENSVNSGLSASEALRRQRSKEAKELIGHSTSAARALFEQNSAQGQMNKRTFNTIPEKPIRSSVVAQRINSLTQQSNNLNAFEEKQPLKTSPIKTIDKIKLSLESPSQIQHEPILLPNASDLSPSETNPSSFSSVITAFDHSSTHSEYVENNLSEDAPEHQPNMAATNDTSHHVDLSQPLSPPIQQPEEIIRHNILENDMFDASLSSNDVEDDDSDNKFSTIKRSPHSRNNISDSSNGHGDLSRQSTVIENVNYKKDGQTNGSSTPEDVSPEALEDDGIYQDLDDDPGLAARALYDYQAADESEITFDPGDIITHIDQIDEGWWQGLGPNGDFGLFPANYVELLPCKPRL